MLASTFWYSTVFPLCWYAIQSLAVLVQLRIVECEYSTTISIPVTFTLQSFRIIYRNSMD